jgi:glucose-6-phosphate-specific signal transduction histidine kinase
MKDVADLEKSFNELQSYSDSQFKSILELKKQIKKLEEEKAGMQSMLESNLPSLTFDGLGVSNEQLICETQITILKDKAVTRELTFEEAKKFAIFSEVLENIKKNTKTSDINVQKMSDAELLKLVEGTNGSAETQS